MSEVRKYEVSYWLHSGPRLEEHSEVVDAYTAKDAADQIRIREKAVCGSSGGYKTRVSIREVKPALVVGEKGRER